MSVDDEFWRLVAPLRDETDRRALKFWATAMLVPIHRDVFDGAIDIESYLEDHPGLMAMIREAAVKFFGHDRLNHKVLHDVHLNGTPWPNYVFIRFTATEET